VKYYIYISDTEVDMLYPQIPKPVLKKIASSLSIDLKLFGAELNIGAKSNPSDETRYAKVKIVSEYTEKNLDVGRIDAPSTYFKGNLLMRWGQFNSNGIHSTSPHNEVYFTGSTQHTLIGLCGSIHHIIGADHGEINKINLAKFPPSSLVGLIFAIRSLEKY
jgi:hypothetical protein